MMADVAISVRPSSSSRCCLGWSSNFSRSCQKPCVLRSVSGSLRRTIPGGNDEDVLHLLWYALCNFPRVESCGFESHRHGKSLDASMN